MLFPYAVLFASLVSYVISGPLERTTQDATKQDGYLSTTLDKAVSPRIRADSEAEIDLEAEKNSTELLP